MASLALFLAMLSTALATTASESARRAIENGNIATINQLRLAPGYEPHCLQKSPPGFQCGTSHGDTRRPHICMATTAETTFQPMHQYPTSTILSPIPELDANDHVSAASQPAIMLGMPTIRGSPLRKRNASNDDESKGQQNNATTTLVSVQPETPAKDHRNSWNQLSGVEKLFVEFGLLIWNGTGLGVFLKDLVK